MEQTLKKNQNGRILKLNERMKSQEVGKLDYFIVINKDFFFLTRFQKKKLS